jgi:hypothetical protein
MNNEAPTLARRVPRLPELARMTSVRRLSEALQSRGHHEHSAAAIALAVCDPAAARRQLDEPGRLRVDGGHLQVIQTDVWTPALIPYPVNPRASTTFAYPAEGRLDRRAPLPELIPATDDDACELVIPPMPSADLIGALDAQTEYLRQTNDLQESVGQLGIREPLLLLPLVIAGHGTEHERDMAVLATVDGSSRLTAAYAHLFLEPSEVLLRLATNERALRQRVASVLGLLTRPLDALSEEELATLRVVSSPATIVVGFVADDSRNGSLAEAIFSRLGILHVDPPRQWSGSSRLDVQLDAALRALEVAGRVDPEEAAWLGSRLDAAETEQAGFRPFPDVRAACLLAHIGGKDSVTSEALRALTSMSRIMPQLRAELAAEGAMRSFRSGLSDTQVTSTRAVLAAIYQMEELKGAWSVDPRVSPGPIVRIRKMALSELELIGSPGPITRQILLLASYWLAKYRIVARQTRGGQKDRRDITTVLSIMANSEHGVRQLTAVIQDGRAGRKPARVDASGVKVMGADGEPVSLDGEWIRETWRLETDEPEAGQEVPGLSPEAELAQRQSSLTLSIKAAVESLEMLNDPQSADELPLVETLGLSTSYVNSVLLDLNKMQERLLLLRMLGSRRNPDDEDTGEA